MRQLKHAFINNRHLTTKPQSLHPHWRKTLLQNLSPSCRQHFVERNPTTLCVLRFFNSSTPASSSSSPSPQLQTYAAISKTLYKQIIKWTKDTGDVPFDPIPPLTLAPPLIEKSSLEHLALMQLQEDDDEKTEKDRRLMKLLPSNTIFDSNQIVIPIEDANSVHNTVKFVFGMNHPKINTDAEESIPAEQEEERQLSVIKDRVSLGFEVLKSLNQLSEMLNERKESRIKHQNRDGVLFHVGQVVQHKTQRWRALVVGWDKRESDAIDKLNRQNMTTSLTTKEYTGENTSNTNMNMMEERHDEEEEVEYTVFLDEGDAVLTRARVIGSKKVKQHELEPVHDPCLKRIRCSMARYLFDKFDSNKNEFHPGDILTYEYPLDNKEGTVDSTGSTGAGAGKGEDRNDESLVDCDNYQMVMDENDIQARNERAQKSAHAIVENTQQVASKWLKDIQEIIRSTSSKDHECDLISDFERDLKDITEGRLLQNASDILTSSTPPSVQKEAVTYVNALLGVVQNVTQVMWHRRTMERAKGRIEYVLGDIVKHKKYNFRGIIAGCDAHPRTDVSRWDGLQHIQSNVNEMPFYHVIADSNDTTEAFGSERRYRYVCQENLERCPVDECKDIELELDDGWSIQKAGTSDVEYVAPDQLKFQHAERLDNEEADETFQKCMENLLMNVHTSLVGMREKSDDHCHMQLDDLFNLLAVSNGFEDAYAIEEFIKEIWKAHKSPEIRWELEDGTEALLRGDKVKALNIFDNIINNEDDKYSEAYNKKSTCHYMIGEMGKSIDAAESACEMEPRHFQAFAGLGLVYNDTAEYGKASKCFRRSLKLQPWSPVSSRLTVCLDLMKRLDIEDQDSDSK